MSAPVSAAPADAIPTVPGSRAAAQRSVSARRPRPWPDPVGDVSELKLLLQPRDWYFGPDQEPRLMAGLVTLAAADQPGVVAALADLKLPATTSVYQRITPTAAWCEAIREIAGHRPTGRGAQLRRALEAVCHGDRPPVRSWVELPEAVAAMRVTEIAVGLQTDPVPALVSTPTSSCGSLQPEALLARVSRAEREGWQPWQLDLEQALLRLPRQVDPQLAARAATLRSPAGLQLARWFAAGPLPDPAAEVIGEPGEPSSHRLQDGARTAGGANRSPSRPRGRRRVAMAPAGNPRTSLHRVLFRLDPFAPPGVAARSLGVASAVRPDLLPHHREVTAAWLLTDLNQVLKGYGATVLRPETARGEPVGPALSLLLAYTLGARNPAARQTGLDALLSFSVTGNLNGRHLGEHLGSLIADEVFPLHLVLPALAGAFQAGALADTWDIIAALLPEVLPGLHGLPRALPNLLTLAADLAGTLKRRDYIPALAPLARRGDASLTVREARRLQTILTGQPPANPP
jgi:hypothetical protein